jgi:hypothetical protein
MKILQRLDKLERSGILEVPAPVWDRLEAALDEAAHRLIAERERIAGVSASG